MAWDRRKPSWIKKAQERELRSYLAQHVYPYSPYYQVLMEGAGVGQRGVRSVDDLAKIPLTVFDDIVNPASVVLRPDEQSIQQFARIGLVARVFWAKLWRREWLVNQRLIDPTYKPLHWHVDDGFPIGSSAEDLERLAELGRRWLELAGVAPYDVLVSVLPPGPNLPYWELVLGCRQAGVAALHLDPTSTVEQVATARPNVLAGRAADLLRLLQAARPVAETFDGLRTVLVAGDRLEEPTRRRLSELVEGNAAVVGAWAPSGVRSLWCECREGGGMHTAPDVELIEIVDPLSGTPMPGGDGEVAWSALGWKGSVFLRLRTGLYASLAEEACPACGRSTPRLLPATVSEPPFARVLDSHPNVLGWQAELRTVGRQEELIVFVSLDTNGGRPGRFLRELDRHLSVTQFVVLDGPGLEERLSAHNDARVVDLRPR